MSSESCCIHIVFSIMSTVGGDHQRCTLSGAEHTVHREWRLQNRNTVSMLRQFEECEMDRIQRLSKLDVGRLVVLEPLDVRWCQCLLVVS